MNESWKESGETASVRQMDSAGKTLCGESPCFFAVFLHKAGSDFDFGIWFSISAHLDMLATGSQDARACQPK